jgi:hypothetical protein
MAMKDFFYNVFNINVIIFSIDENYNMNNINHLSKQPHVFVLVTFCDDDRYKLSHVEALLENYIHVNNNSSNVDFVVNSANSVLSKNNVPRINSTTRFTYPRKLPKSSHYMPPTLQQK